MMQRHLADKIEFVQAALAARGLPVKGSSRLDREARVFRDDSGAFTSLVSKDHPQFDHALEALRDYSLFEHILDPWPFGDDEIAAVKLKRALKDAVLPFEQANTRTEGRDTQLELVVAAALVRSGAGVKFVATHLESQVPDLRTTAGGGFFFVEAKRTKSYSGVINAIIDATEQLETTGCPGAIYVDVTMSFNEKNVAVVNNWPRAAMNRLHANALQHVFEPLRTAVDDVIAGTRVATILFEDHMLAPIDGQYALHTSQMTYDNPRRSKKLRKAGEQFLRSLDAGWLRA